MLQTRQGGEGHLFSLYSQGVTLFAPRSKSYRNQKTVGANRSTPPNAAQPSR
jgi:hypothetical protein